MKPHEFKAALHALDWTQQHAAGFLGESLRTVHRQAAGTYPVREADAKLLRLLVRLKLTMKPDNFDDLIRMLESTSKRGKASSELRV